jgi:hypothetical protein
MLLSQFVLYMETLGYAEVQTSQDREHYEMYKVCFPTNTLGTAVWLATHQMELFPWSRA